MTNGTIQISKVNLMGYTAETQMYYVQNKNGVATFNFLKSIAKFLDLTSQGYIINARRLPTFKRYCESNGFQVVEN